MDERKLYASLRTLYERATRPLLQRTFIRESVVIPIALVAFCSFTLAFAVWQLAQSGHRPADNTGCIIAAISISSLALLFSFYLLWPLVWKCLPTKFRLRILKSRSKVGLSYTDESGRISGEPPVLPQPSISFKSLPAWLSTTNLLAFALLRLSSSVDADAGSYFTDLKYFYLLDLPWVAYMALGVFLGEHSFTAVGVILNNLDLYHRAIGNSGDTLRLILSILFFTTIYYDPVRLYFASKTKRKAGYAHAIAVLFSFLELTMLIANIILRASVFTSSLSDFASANGLFILISTIHIVYVSRELLSLKKEMSVRLHADLLDNTIDPSELEFTFADVELGGNQGASQGPSGELKPQKPASLAGRFVLPNEIKDLINSCDHDGDGALEWLEFVCFCKLLRGTAAPKSASRYHWTEADLPAFKKVYLALQQHLNSSDANSIDSFFHTLSTHDLNDKEKADMPESLNSASTVVQDSRPTSRWTSSYGVTPLFEKSRLSLAAHPSAMNDLTLITPLGVDDSIMSMASLPLGPAASTPAALDSTNPLIQPRSRRGSEDANGFSPVKVNGRWSLPHLDAAAVGAIGMDDRWSQEHLQKF